MKWILYFTCSLTLLQNVWAWGPEGHMIVAQIAENQLTVTAKKSVSKLLSGKTMASVSNWADSIKGQTEWAHTKPWHFVDVADGENYDSITHAPEGDVITAITQMINVLKDQKASDIDKQNALKFIVHFVGDIHQPLHVGRPGDRGGNSIKVIFEGFNTNLHQLWDSGMITKQQMDYIQYTQYLETHGFMAPSTDIPEIPFRQIVIEDMGARKQIYEFKGTNNVVLDASYMNANLDTMNSRLLLGGKRLAGILNSVFK